MSEPENARAAVLLAAHRHIAKACLQQNKDFVQCKREDPDPHRCLKQGAAVTSCVARVLGKLSQACPDDLDNYAKCLDKQDHRFDKCRKEQAALEAACPVDE
mmetsp:Transcript_63165/g.149677  ORF Transcript_63165/g.149677 Transcript_63165/m.149677 type:complete len:102 (+) Transcript_63165:11-316(+)